MEPIAPRFEVVSGQLTHPLRPGVMGQVAKWPTGVYTLVSGSTHYSIPQAWAAAQIVLTPAPEVGWPMSVLAAIRHIPPEGTLTPFDILTIRLPCTSHVDVEHHGCGEVAVHIFGPSPELLAALHKATASACHDGDCPCYQAGEESEKEAP